MIIGRGLLANAFAREWQRDESTVILAAGVSNSAETSLIAFEREESLIQEVISNSSIGRVVYFGSCAVGSQDEYKTPYLLHKERMEALVLADERGRVFRLPQVVGRGGNPHTLMNFLRSHIQAGITFDVWARAERNLIDIDDVATIGTHVLRQDGGFPSMMSIADTHSTNILEIVRCMENVLGCTGNYRILEKGVPFPIDTRYCEQAAAECEIPLGDGYLRKLMQKYHLQY